MSIVQFGNVINNLEALHRAMIDCRYKINTTSYNGSFAVVAALTNAITAKYASEPKDVRAALAAMSREALNFFKSEEWISIAGRIDFLDDQRMPEFDGTYFINQYINTSRPLSRQGGDYNLERMISRSPFGEGPSSQSLITWNGVNVSEVNQYVERNVSVSPLEYLNVNGGWATHEDNLSVVPNAIRVNTCYVTEDAIYFLSKCTVAFGGGDSLDINLPPGTESLVFDGYIECVRHIDGKEVVGAEGSIFMKNNDTNLPTLTFGGGAAIRLPIGKRVRQTVKLSDGPVIGFGVAVPATQPNCFVVRMKGKFYLTPCGNIRAVTGGYFNVLSPDCSDMLGANFALTMMKIEGACADNSVMAVLNRRFVMIMESAIARLRPRGVVYEWNFRSGGEFYRISQFMAAFFDATPERSGLSDEQVHSLIELGRKVITIMVVLISHYERS